MIAFEDRQSLARDIDVAHIAGARQEAACEVAAVDVHAPALAG